MESKYDLIKQKLSDVRKEQRTAGGNRVYILAGMEIALSEMLIIYAPWKYFEEKD